VGAFAGALIDDLVAREGARMGPVTRVADARDVVTWARKAGLAEVVAPHVPVGPAAEALEGLGRMLSGAGVRLVRPLRPYDAAAWPHATHGFFKFREAIPGLLGEVRGWRLL
jgi:deoxyribodipyrimidine photo-lyase